MQRNATTTAFTLTMALATSFGLVACKKSKKDGDPAAKSTGGEGSSSATGTGATGGSASAEGGALTGLKAETACPKSLGGNDKGLSRTIKKECGVVPVTESYSVDEGELILEAGAQLAVAPGAQIRIGYYGPAKLTVKGTPTDPVVMTAAGDKAAGSWTGLHLANHASRSSVVGLVIEFAGTDEEGGLVVAAEDVTVKDSTFRDLKGFGLQVLNDGSVVDVTGNTFERAGTIAVSLPPNSVGALGANTFKDGFVQIRGGTADRDATWKNPGTHYVVAEQVNVDGKNARNVITVEAGTELRMSREASLRIGYYSAGGMKIAGSKDKPVVFKAAEGAEPGAWQGVQVYSNGELTVEGAVLEHGGGDGEMGAIAGHGGTLAVKDTVLRGNATGLTATDGVKLKSVDGTSFEGNTLAARLYPVSFGAFGAANVYAAGQRIEITGGTAGKDATWSLQPGAEVYIKDQIDVAESTLTIEPGVELRFDGNAFRIGYYNKANLRVRGTADKPVVMRGFRDEAESWVGLELHANVDSSVLEHLVIADTSGDAAITVHGRAKVDVKTLTIKRSKAGIAWPCEAKISTEAVKIEGGGKAEVKPEGC